MSFIFKGVDEGISTTISIGIITGLMSTLMGYNAYFWRRKKTESDTGKLSITQKLQQIRTTSVISNIILIVTTLSSYYLLNDKRIKPAAVLAGIPLGTVEELSMALSDRILKYRSTGGIFLAHQSGGNESLRIICKAWGGNKYWFLILIDFIFLYGQSKILDMFALTKENVFTVGRDKSILSKTAKVVNPWREFKEDNVDEGREEYHMTFPIVTKNRIYSSMFLETYDIVESVNNGMNMLTITLFLRKYRVPYPYELIILKTPNPKTKKEDTTFWYRAEKVKGQTIDTKFKSLRWADSVLDFGLSLIVMGHKYIMLKKYSIYTWDQMIALSAASILDKSTGVESGDIFGITENLEGTTVVVNETVEKGMGMMM
ncbi:hypothetical protein LCGC14_1210370 [marine sediment metagenome]|uniref:Uncharacterized protein n=1 Tax=marine sediment metagenome TaxID=412755 RepID=A0A0F9NWJ5_9ZZZZ